MDWEAIAKALLMKYGGARGHALLGAGTISWARQHVEVTVEPDGDALTLRWKAPPLNGSEEVSNG